MIWTERPYRWVLWFQICIYYHHLTLSHFNSLLQDWLKYLLLGEGNRLLGLESWMWKLLSHVQRLVTPWTLQSMEFSRPEYWSGLHFLTPGDLPNPGIKPRYPTLKADSAPAEPPGKPKNHRVGSLSLLQQSFPTQELNWCLQLCRQNLSQLSYLENPEVDQKWRLEGLVSKRRAGIYFNILGYAATLKKELRMHRV